ncbi:MAG TPA: hypothetical protein VGP38_09745, partial [Rubrobacter sp.]|nr:hypothetical protein [Rubrobacter sp.]
MRSSSVSAAAPPQEPEGDAGLRVWSGNHPQVEHAARVDGLRLEAGLATEDRHVFEPAEEALGEAARDVFGLADELQR